MDLNDGSWTCQACTFQNNGKATQCGMCDMPDTQPSYAVPIDAVELQYLASQINYPLVMRVEDLKQLPLMLQRAGPKKEFSISWTFHPAMVAGAIMAGVFPMSTNIWDIAFPAYKLHVERCVMKPPGIVHKRTRKRAAQYSVSVNTCFDRACDLIVEHHENCWLCPALRRSLKYIQSNPDKFPQIRILSWEVWAKPEEPGQGEHQLAAVEIGFIVGSIYCSMTGAYRREFPGAGSLQLACTGGWLVREKIALWDFGMAMEYKEAMGAQRIPRQEWLATVEKLGAAPISPTLLDSMLARIPCTELMPFTTLNPK